VHFLSVQTNQLFNYFTPFLLLFLCFVLEENNWKLYASDSINEPVLIPASYSSFFAHSQLCVFLISSPTVNIAAAAAAKYVQRTLATSLYIRILQLVDRSVVPV